MIVGGQSLQLSSGLPFTLLLSHFPYCDDHMLDNETISITGNCTALAPTQLDVLNCTPKCDRSLWAAEYLK